MGPVEEDEESFKRKEKTLTAQVIILSIFLVGVTSEIHDVIGISPGSGIQICNILTICRMELSTSR